MPQSEFRKLQAKHEALYKKAIEEFVPPASNTEDASDIVREEIDPLLREFESFSLNAKNVEQYKWLSDAVGRWQIVLSNMNVPREITLHLPSLPLQPLPSPKEY